MSSKPPFRTLIVNTIGEPGCGKTTLSFWLCQALKHEGAVIEFVPEVVKYECFTPQGRARVASGKFDRRYINQQARLIHALLGQVEVLVNDGPFEVFAFYAKRRMGVEAFSAFEAGVHSRIHAQDQATGFGKSLFVAPVRSHHYELHGRLEDAEQASALRQELLDYLGSEFGVRVRHVSDATDRDRLLADILAQVKALKNQ